MNIKLIGVDLDATLLKDHNIIDEYTLSILKKAHDKGIHIVPITGRPYAGLPKSVTESGLMDYAITTNGAYITSLKDGKRLFTSEIEPNKVLELIDKLNDFKCKIEVFAEDYGHVEPEHYQFYKDNYTGTDLESYIFSSRKVKESIKDYVNKGNACGELFAIFEDSQARDKALKSCQAIEGIQICRLSDKFLEITKAGVNKGEALEKLCNILGVSLCDTIAFGDGENDLEFLAKAGISVAMENACDKVKTQADIIAPSNLDSGVGIILNKYI